MLGVVASVGEHRTDADHDGKGGEEQPFEDERVVDVGCGRGAGHGHAVPIHRDVVLCAPLGSVRRVGAGEVAAALRADGAAIQDQVGMTTQHADQQGKSALIGRIRRAPQIQFCYELAGSWDLLLLFDCASMAEFNQVAESVLVMTCPSLVVLVMGWDLGCRWSAQPSMKASRSAWRRSRSVSGSAWLLPS